MHQLQGLYLVSLPGTALRVFAWRCGGPVVWRAAGVHDLLKLTAQMHDSLNLALWPARLTKFNAPPFRPIFKHAGHGVFGLSRASLSTVDQGDCAKIGDFLVSCACVKAESRAWCAPCPGVTWPGAGPAGALVDVPRLLNGERSHAGVTKRQKILKCRKNGCSVAKTEPMRLSTMLVKLVAPKLYCVEQQRRKVRHVDWSCRQRSEA